MITSNNNNDNTPISVNSNSNDNNHNNNNNHNHNSNANRAARAAAGDAGAAEMLGLPGLLHLHYISHIKPSCIIVDNIICWGWAWMDAVSPSNLVLL